MRINASKRDRDGWQGNVATGDEDGYEQDRWNARIKVNWTPTDDLQLELVSDWLEEDDHPGYWNVLEAPCDCSVGLFEAFAAPVFNPESSLLSI